MPADFFGTPWKDVTLDVVDAFLADADDETLTWEAKGGGQQPHRGSVLKAGSGFGNAVGGFLIIGADRVDGRWTLPGVAFRSNEPATWLSSIIENGLRPVPFFDVLPFAREDGKYVAVVGFDEVEAPPCRTADGHVYKRVSGQTVRVTDERVLDDMQARGRAVRLGAERLAARAAAVTLEVPTQFEPEQAVFSIALTPVSGASDKSAILFSRSFATEIQTLLTQRLQPEPPLQYPVGFLQRQDHVRFFTSSTELGQSWTTVAYWDGSVSAVYASVSTEHYTSETVQRVKGAWRVLVDVARRLGGSGDAHLVITFNVANPSVPKRGVFPAAPIRRWTSLTEPTDTELARVERELRRSFGENTWEPEPEEA